MVDSDGFLWYSTTNGKVIKDLGKRKLVVPLLSDLKFDPTFIYDIFQANDGNIWVGCRLGAYIINPYTFEAKLLTWKPKNSTLNTGFVDFVQKEDGTIWIATKSNHIISYKNSVFKEIYVTSFEEEEEERYRGLILALNNNDQLVICQYAIINKNIDYTHKLFTITNKQLEYIGTMPYKSKVFFLPKGQKNINKNKKEGVYYYNGLKSTYLYYPKIDAYALIRFENDPNQEVSPFLNKRHSILKNNILIEKMNDVIQFQEIEIKTDTIIFTNIMDLKNQRKGKFLTLNEDVLLIGESNKISKVKPYKKTVYGVTTFLYNYKEPISTRAIILDSLNNIFVTSYQGVYRIDSKSAKESLYMDHIGIYSTVKENDSIVWGVESSNFHKINLKTNKEIITNVPFISWILERKSEEELWLGTTKGLYVYNTTTNKYFKFNPLNKEFHIENFYIRDILQLPDHTLWIATDDNGAFLYNLNTKEVIHYSKNNPEHYIPHDIVLDIYKDKNNTVWIAGNRGLTRIDKNNTIQNYTVSDGLSNTIVCSILETKDYIWAATYGGINRISISDSTAPSPEIDNLLYDVEFNHKSALKKNDSTLFFGSINGVYELNTKQVSFDNSKVSMLPISIKKYDEVTDTIVEKFIGIKDLKKMDLDYNHDFFEFEFALDNTFNYSKDKYRYTIDGLTPNWVSLGNESIIRQYGIRPGNYTLRVTGKNENGAISSNILVMPIHVAQVFYKSKPFLVGYLLLGIALIYLWQRRIKKKRIQNKLIDNLEIAALRSQMNPHFIFNTINGIQSDIMFKTPEIVNDYISSFSQLLRITMNMTVKGTITIQQELEYLEAYVKLQQHRLEHRFSYEINVDSNNYNLDDIKIPSMLFQPIVENAIIHGLEPKKEAPKNLKITFTIGSNTIIGCIEDNGVGRKKGKGKKKKHTSVALSIMKKRIKITNQLKRNSMEMEIIDLVENNKKTGTKVLFTILISN